MADKRRDSKGRVLKTGEVQLKDGRYQYRYTDSDGVRHAIYSWKLVETNKVPNGKRCDEDLRTAEQRIAKDMNDGILSDQAKKITVNMLFDGFLKTRTDLKETTQCNYICLYDKHIRDDFGEKYLDGIKYSSVYKLYMSLNQEHNLSVSSITKINAILWQLFEMPVHDNIIRRNPTSGVMIDVARKLKEEQKKRSALTVEQQARFVDYIYHSNKYKRYGPLFTTLLGTGMRIGEALGLRWSDVDFKDGMIKVDHALSYKETLQGGYEYHISSTKTSAGIREIPMFSDVKDALKKEKRRTKHLKADPFIVDGYSGFIFLNTAGKVYVPSFVYDTIQNIVTDYNNEETAKARQENRKPDYLPKLSAHILRHTFCTRLCENEANMKVVQTVMGHKNIRTTMNVYTDAMIDTRKASFAGLEGKIKLC